MAISSVMLCMDFPFVLIILESVVTFVEKTFDPEKNHYNLILWHFPLWYQ